MHLYITKNACKNMSTSSVAHACARFCKDAFDDNPRTFQHRYSRIYEAVHDQQSIV